MKRVDRRTLGIWIAVVMLYVIGLVTSNGFRSPGNTLDILRSVSVIGCLAVGQTIVIIVRGFDLSQTGVAALAGLVAAWLVKFGDFDVAVAILLACIVGLCFGIINGLIIISTGLSGFITTLGTYSVAVGLGFVIAPGGIVNIGNPDFLWLGRERAGLVPISVILLVLVVAIAAFSMGKTTWGRQIYSAGANPAAARLYGSNVPLLLISAYAVSGLLAAVAGVTTASLHDAGLQAVATIGLGDTDLLDSVAAVLVGGVSLAGGVGSVTATFGGVFLIGTLNNYMALLGLSQTYMQIVRGTVLIGGAVAYSPFLRELLDKRHPFRVRRSTEGPIEAQAAKSQSVPVEDSVKGST